MLHIIVNEFYIVFLIPNITWLQILGATFSLFEIIDMLGMSFITIVGRNQFILRYPAVKKSRKMKRRNNLPIIPLLPLSVCFFRSQWPFLVLIKIEKSNNILCTKADQMSDIASRKNQ